MKLISVLFVVLAATAAGGASAASSSDIGLSLQPRSAGAPLPVAVRRYRDAVNAEDLNRLTASFTPDALVIDVSRRFRGRSAIRAWAQAEVIGGRLTVIRRVTRPRNPRGVTYLVRFAPGGRGGFLAHYRFEARGGRITVADLQYP
jgi:SnoaL-like domain